MFDSHGDSFEKLLWLFFVVKESNPRIIIYWKHKGNLDNSTMVFKRVF